MIMKLLGLAEPLEMQGESFDQKRRFVRRSCDKCVAVINGKTYPVQNWSQGGVLITGDARLFAKKDEMDVTIKFHVEDRIIPVNNAGKIVRKNRNRIALAFEPIAPETRKNFQSVIDHINAVEFAQSQV